ncbi:hypothetical protein [Novipirellula rosea]|uniref:Uncharacterized protein n=1 Tax=Novipirellula rosea TaxID=1031540 RepID=A0ABP8M5P6_9BACT
MGIELAVACVPYAQLNDLRVQALHDRIDRLTDEDLEFDNDTLVSEDHDRVELVRILHDQIDLIRSAEEYWRHVNHVRLPELSYEVLVAGGYTHGEPPSDLYRAFRIAGDCEPLWALLIEWAKEDFQSRVN